MRMTIRKVSGLPIHSLPTNEWGEQYVEVETLDHLLDLVALHGELRLLWHDGAYRLTIVDDWME